MSNELLKFANEVRLVAKDLEAAEPMNIKKMPILIDEKVKRRMSQEVQAYKTFLRKFLMTKGNDKILGILKPLFDNLRTKKPKNTLLTMIDSQSNRKQEQVIGEDIGDVLDQVMKMETFARSKKLSLFTGLLLLKEILNYGVVKGVNPFKMLLSRPGLLKSTFKDEGKLERQTEEVKK